MICNASLNSQAVLRFLDYDVGYDMIFLISDYENHFEKIQYDFHGAILMLRPNSYVELSSII